MVLLLLLVVGVWGLLLRPAATPTPVQAQNGDGIPPARGLFAYGNGLYLYAPSGNIYHFGLDLKLLDRAFPGDDAQRRTTYTVVHEPLQP
jgi:hypothetical protein